jgi:small subunit ribosomal protein S2
MCAEAYLEGAKEWSEKVRANPEQETRTERAERPERQEQRPQRPSGRDANKPTTAAGPAVVKVSKRKLVAAGTAEDVEIAMELEAPTEETVAEEELAAETPVTTSEQKPTSKSNDKPAGKAAGKKDKKS